MVGEVTIHRYQVLVVSYFDGSSNAHLVQNRKDGAGIRVHE